ncbi:Hypothetical predicted protein [Cloeon dipterum]|uniref:Uncharacterized protein n=1 Tax=Cloeon dipterum TaxID=197152 RepID=A0A8S1DX14_9INSE|nr:Hypothetical predicted protein [Cloeon dipterum]
MTIPISNTDPKEDDLISVMLIEEDSDDDVMSMDCEPYETIRRPLHTARQGLAAAQIVLLLPTEKAADRPSADDKDLATARQGLAAAQEVPLLPTELLLLTEKAADRPSADDKDLATARQGYAAA